MVHLTSVGLHYLYGYWELPGFESERCTQSDMIRHSAIGRLVLLRVGVHMLDQIEFVVVGLVARL